MQWFAPDTSFHIKVAALLFMIMELFTGHVYYVNQKTCSKGAI